MPQTMPFFISTSLKNTRWKMNFLDRRIKKRASQAKAFPFQPVTCFTLNL